MPSKQEQQIQQSILWGMCSTFLLFCVSGFSSSQRPFSDSGQEEQVVVTPSLMPPSQVTLHSSSVPPEAITGWDENQGLFLLRETGVLEPMSMEDYLWGVVAAEMPGSFPLEALKAQTVAARTYTMLRLEQSDAGKHGLGVLCDNSNCCQAYIDVAPRLESWGSEAMVYQEKIQTAVEETDGLFVLYQGELIDAVFFSSVAGQTLEAQEVWGSSLPYLQSVDSREGEEVPNYHSEVVLSVEEVREKLQQKYPEMLLSTEPEFWFEEFLFSDSGSVVQCTIAGVALTGAQVRSLFGLRATHFLVNYENEVFTFSVTGYGHGVGMSQYGASAMAEDGIPFHEILTWYYTDTEVKGIPVV